MSKILGLILVVGTLSMAGSKDKDWQFGKVLDPIYNKYFGETEASGTYNPSHAAFAKTSKVNTAGTELNQVTDTYVIETDEAVYRVERVRLKMALEVKVKSYSKIRFAVDKNHLWLEDAEGKQYSTKIVEKKLKNI